MLFFILFLPTLSVVGCVYMFCWMSQEGVSKQVE